MLETSHPPTYYLPRDACFAEGVLRETSGSSWCEWKGQATYYDLVTEYADCAESRMELPEPGAGFEPIAVAVAVGAVVGGCRPVQGGGHVRGHVEPVVGYRQVRPALEIAQWPEFE